MTRKLLLASAAALTFITNPVYAQNEGFYAGVAGGANIIHSGEINGTGFSDEYDHDGGIVGTGSVGYKYDNGFRNELELGYRKNNSDTIANGNATGSTQVYSAMVNLLFDLDITDNNIETYVGAGAGAAIINHNNAGPVQATRLDDSDVTPAFQGIAGLSYALSDKTDIYLNYQYFHAADPNFKTDDGNEVDSDYDSSTFLMGIKVNLSPTERAMPEPIAPARVSVVEPEPIISYAPPPPVAEAISRTYIIFFDLDDARVTNDARAILAQAAEDARTGNAVSIQVVGHADSSGGNVYNMDLSQRRADSVHHALSNMGINPHAMDTIARGESDLLVPTADGVREAQNRRVEVTYIINP